MSSTTMSQAFNQAVSDDALSVPDMNKRAKALLSQTNGFRLDAPRALRLLRFVCTQSPEAAALICVGDIYSRAYDGVNANCYLALKYFRRASKRGSTVATIRQAKILREWPFISDANFKKARLLLERAAAEGEPEAMYMLAKYYIIFDDPHDSHRLVSLFRAAAELGFAPAIREMGQIMYIGVYDVEPDENSGLELLQSASDKGDAESMAFLAEILISRSEGPHDKALVLYRKAVARGNTDAHYELAKILLHGYYGVLPDVDRAVALLEYAVARGHMGAECYLGIFLVDEGRKNDEGKYVRGLELLAKASEVGDRNAMYNLGAALLTGFPPTVAPDVGRAFELLRSAAALGSVQAMDRVGYLCVHGEEYGIETDAEMCLQYYRQAAEHGYIPAMMDLACVLLYGDHGVEQDVEEALSLFEQSYDHGCDRAALALAKIYRFGTEGVSVDMRRSVRMYRAAVTFGSDEAVMQLAWILRHGAAGVAQDIPAAIELYEGAISSSYAEAEFELACMLNPSIIGGAESDMDRAVALYRSASEKGHLGAQAHLGALLLNCFFCAETDEAEGMRLLEGAVQKGSPAAMYQLGRVLDLRRNERVGNLERALQLYHEASDAGELNATIRLAYMHLNANGVEHAPRKFVTFMETAIERGSTYAMTDLAQFYRTGDDEVSIDVRRAVDLFRMAHAHGHRSAHCHLADILLNGEGDVEQDVDEALELYQWGVDHGWNFATEKMAMFYENGLHGHIEKDMNRALKLYVAAGEQGHATSFRKAANIVASGSGGVPKDVKKAVQYYQKAIDEYDVESMHELGKLYETGADDMFPNLNGAISLYCDAVQYSHHGALVSLSLLLLNGRPKQNRMNPSAAHP